MISTLTKPDLSTHVQIRQHELISDVSSELGGHDTGPNPHELLETSLATCTGITVQMYANRKKWSLTSVQVSVKIISETRDQTVISRDVSFLGDLTSEERELLLQIANKCPIHRLLSGPVLIQTVMSPGEVV